MDDANLKNLQIVAEAVNILQSEVNSLREELINLIDINIELTYRIKALENANGNTCASPGSN